MTKSLLVKALAVVVAVVLLQLAVAPDSKAQEGYGGGGWGGHGGGRGFYYKVHYGDTLFAICRKFGVDPYKIARINGLPNPNHIYAGQVLYIPSGASCPTCGVNHYPEPYPSRWQGGGGCGNNCYQQGCGNNCNNSGHHGGGCGGNDCNNSSHHGGGCGNNCYQQGSGYDYTGYYYDGYYPNYQRYSYTCGYNYNCY